MFDIGWSEMVLAAVIGLVILGPRDLPHALRALGRLTRNMRHMAYAFRAHLDAALGDDEKRGNSLGDSMMAPFNPLDPTNREFVASQPPPMPSQDQKQDQQGSPDPLLETTTDKREDQAGMMTSGVASPSLSQDDSRQD